MSYFKVGDKVRCIFKQSANCKEIKVGHIGYITHINRDGSVAVDNMFGHNGNAVCWPEAFEKIKEEPKQMFNIKTDPWFIRVNSKQEFEVIQDWLQENYGTCLSSNYYSSMVYLTNSYADGGVRENFVMHGSSDPLEKQARKEVKLTFKTTIDSVEYPVVKSKEQIKIEQLQATIGRACQEIKELLEMGEKE